VRFLGVRTLDRLLEGLDVAVEPLPPARADRGAAGPHERRGPAVLDLACGTSVRCSSDRITVVPPPRPVRVAPPVTGIRIRVTYQGAIDLFDQLDGPLVARIVPGDSLHACFQELLDEIAMARPGRCVMVLVLARRLLILLLRRCLEGGGDLPVWLVALEDNRLVRAVGAMRDRPEHVFTVTELAELAGMSRTVFAARFTSAMARPPIEFLKGLRFARAAQLLVRTDLPVKAIASRVGYASRSSFTRAFVARHGAAPADFRVAAADR
jgi:AraC-like DNA-binding protein